MVRMPRLALSKQADRSSKLSNVSYTDKLFSSKETAPPLLSPRSYYRHARHNRLNALAEALAAKRLPLHTAIQDAVDLPKMVQVVCRFQADELLDRLPSAYLVDPIALHHRARGTDANSRRLLSRSARKTPAERLASCCA